MCEDGEHEESGDSLSYKFRLVRDRHLRRVLSEKETLCRLKLPSLAVVISSTE